MTSSRYTVNFPNISKMGQESQPSLVYVERVPLKYGYIGMLFTIGFFQLVNKIVTVNGAPKSAQTNFFRWKNTFISWIHALIIGSWDLSCWWLYPEMTDNLLEHFEPYVYYMVVFSTGYFIYDFLDLAREGRIFSSWEIVIHHWAVISMFFYNVVTCHCIAYNAVALLAEVNSFFLHSRKLLQMSQVDFKSVLYQSVCYLNLLSFIPCRFGACSAILYGMTVWGNRVTKPYYFTLLLAMVMMMGVNFILYYRLIKSDIMRGFSKSSHKKEIYNNANNNVKEAHAMSELNHNINHTNNVVKSKTT